MDWLRARRVSQPPPAEPHDLVPIRLYSADAAFAASMDPAGERLSDMLQRGDELSILPEGADHRDPEAWLSVNLDLLLLVVPPPHVSRPELRLHRQRQAVQIRTGPYLVSGTAHLKPGYAQDAFVRARQPFLPLTDAVIEREAEAPEHVEVVIVNLALMEQFREL